MKIAIITTALLLALAGCSGEQQAASGAATPVGSDRDEHGCIASAGYQWCARTGQCERPWELAESENFGNTQEEFAGFCGS